MRTDTTCAAIHILLLLSSLRDKYTHILQSCLAVGWRRKLSPPNSIYIRPSSPMQLSHNPILVCGRKMSDQSMQVDCVSPISTPSSSYSGSQSYTASISDCSSHGDGGATSISRLIEYDSDKSYSLEAGEAPVMSGALPAPEYATLSDPESISSTFDGDASARSASRLYRSASSSSSRSHDSNASDADRVQYQAASTREEGPPAYSYDSFGLQTARNWERGPPSYELRGPQLQSAINWEHEPDGASTSSSHSAASRSTTDTDKSEFHITIPDSEYDPEIWTNPDKMKKLKAKLKRPLRSSGRFRRAADETHAAVLQAQAEADINMQERHMSVRQLQEREAARGGKEKDKRRKEKEQQEDARFFIWVAGVLRRRAEKNSMGPNDRDPRDEWQRAVKKKKAKTEAKTHLKDKHTRLKKQRREQEHEKAEKKIKREQHERHAREERGRSCSSTSVSDARSWDWRRGCPTEYHDLPQNKGILKPAPPQLPKRRSRRSLERAYHKYDIEHPDFAARQGRVPSKNHPSGPEKHHSNKARAPTPRPAKKKPFTYEKAKDFPVGTRRVSFTTRDHFDPHRDGRGYTRTRTRGVSLSSRGGSTTDEERPRRSNYCSSDASTNSTSSASGSLGASSSSSTHFSSKKSAASSPRSRPQRHRAHSPPRMRLKDGQYAATATHAVLTKNSKVDMMFTGKVVEWREWVHNWGEAGSKLCNHDQQVLNWYMVEAPDGRERFVPGVKVEWQKALRTWDKEYMGRR